MLTSFTSLLTFGSIMQALTDHIVQGGLIFIVVTVFIECGFFAGFFLPGDSMLFLAGFMAGQGRYPIWLAIILIFCAAVAGNTVGYHVGAKAGPRLFSKEDGIFFQKGNILKAQQFFEKHGGKTVILARFVPVLRTFAPLVAGIGSMTFRRFFIFSSMGAAVWAAAVTASGYVIYHIVGKALDIGPYMEAIFVVVIAGTIGWSLFHAWYLKRKHQSNVSADDLEAEQAKAKLN